MSGAKEQGSEKDGAEPPRPRRRHRRATRAGVEQPIRDEKSWENDDRAWGDTPENRDEQLRRDVPPHWG